jgi:hypothetical protein
LSSSFLPLSPPEPLLLVGSSASDRTRGLELRGRSTLHSIIDRLSGSTLLPASIGL